MTIKKIELIQRFVDMVNTVKNQKIQEIRKNIGMMKLSSGRVVIFDKEDEAKILKYNWVEQPDGYIRSTGKPAISLHRFILNLTSNDKIDVDHINGIKWDARKSNLRLATHQQNTQNKLLQKSNTSGVKGVCYRKQKDKRHPGWEKKCWYARIGVNGKTYCKYFPYTNEGLQQGKKWYDQMSQKYHKDFAKTNDMIQDQEKILAELNLIIRDISLPTHYVPWKNLTDYFNVSISQDKKKSIKRYSAEIQINGKKYQKSFRYNSAGKILAAEFINQLLIRYSPNGKDDKRFNKIDYTVVADKELQIEREYMNERDNKMKTSKYIGVLKYTRKHKYKSGKNMGKIYWKATINYQCRTYTQSFPYTDEGEKLAAKWYNEKAKELFDEKIKINIID